MSIYLGSSEPSKIYVGSSEVKEVYVGTTKVRPNQIVCDFTQSDCGFTYKGDAGNIYYGRDSNGFYGTAIGSGQDVYWSVPSSIYSKGLPSKVVITFTGTADKFGGGFYCVTGGVKTLRHYTALRVLWGGQNVSDSETLPANTLVTLTIDFANKTIYTDYSSKSITLTDNAISAFTSDRSAGNVTISLQCYAASSTTYIKNATFYF